MYVNIICGMPFSVRSFQDINIKPKYIFRFECHIMLSYYFITSSLLSAKLHEDGHYGTLQDTLSEIDEGIQLLILLPDQLLLSMP